MPNLSLSIHAGVEKALGRSLTWRLGRWLYLGSRRELINDPALNGEYALQGWLLDAVEREPPDQPPVFVDVGANLGDWTERLIQTIGRRRLASATVHAFEPAPAQRKALTDRLTRRQPGVDLRIDARGLGGDCGRARFVVRGERAGSNGLAVDGSDDGGSDIVEIEVATLDQICAERGYHRLFLVKVDTEGNDFNVVRGARGLFEANAIGALQFEYNWRWIQFGHTLNSVFNMFAGSDYAVGKLTAGGVEFYAAWHPEIERYTETNYLILHKDLLGGVPHWWAQFDKFNALAGHPRGRGAESIAVVDPEANRMGER